MSQQSIQINGKLYNGNLLTKLINEKLSKGELWEQKVYAFFREWYNRSNTIKLKTSGSTGKAKEITFKKHHLIQSASITINYFKLKPNSKVLLCLPADYVAAKLMIVRAIVGNLNLVLLPPTGEPLKYLNEIIDFTAMVPLQVINTLANHPNKLNFINQLIVGGQKLPDECIPKLKYLPLNVWETYGMTETLTHVALKEISPNSLTSFLALSGISFDTDNRSCLTISGDHLPINPIITNDIVDLISENEFQLIGRIDNVINSGGIKISIEELESKLSPFINQPFAIGSLIDKTLGEKIVLIVEKNSLLKPMDDAYAKAGLTKFEIPKEIIIINKIPTTSSGKIERHKIRELLS